MVVFALQGLEQNVLWDYCTLGCLAIPGDNFGCHNGQDVVLTTNPYYC